MPRRSGWPFTTACFHLRIQATDLLASIVWALQGAVRSGIGGLKDAVEDHDVIARPAHGDVAIGDPRFIEQRAAGVCVALAEP